MPKMYLKQHVFTYSVCGPFNKREEMITKIKETWDSRYIYENQWDKPSFQYNMSYLDINDLDRRTVSGKIFPDKAFDIAKSKRYVGYQCGIVSVIYHIFENKLLLKKGFILIYFLITKK